MAEKMPWDDPVLEPDDAKKLRARTRRMKAKKKQRKEDRRPIPLSNVKPSQPGSEAIALAKKLKKRNQGVAAGTGNLAADKTLLKKKKKYDSKEGAY